MEQASDATDGGALGVAEPYFRPEVVEHEVVNATEGAFACLGIEIRRQG